MGAAWFLAASLLLDPERLARTEAPPFTILSEPGLSAEAERIATAMPGIISRLMSELGARSLPESTLYLISRDAESGIPQASGMPIWAAGLALPRERTVVIRADRLGSYRQRQLLGVVAHEIAHLMMFEAAGAGARLMPIWFREGVAANLARDGEWMDFMYLWISTIPTSAHPLSGLTDSFEARDSDLSPRTAYAGSFSFARFAMQRHTPALPSRILTSLREGLDFERAYQAAAGVALSVDEAAWSAELRGRTRWAAILTSSAALWLVISLLFVLAYLLKKHRAARTMDRWREEDPFG